MSYPQYPQSGGMSAYPQQPLPPQQVSGGAAIATGVLAGLGAAWYAVSFLISLFGFGLIGTAPTGLVVIFFVGLIANLALAVLLGVGAVMIFTKKPLGKWLVVGGCGLAIGLQLIGLIVGLAMSGSGRVGGMVGGGIASLIFMIPAIATLVLALLPMTGQWLNQGKQPIGHPQATPGGYPQAAPGGYSQPMPGGYPQSGQPPRQW